MKNKENGERSISPCLKKRVRICSLNTSGRKVLTQCSVDLNTTPVSPQACISPKIINLHKKKPVPQIKNDEVAQIYQKDKRLRNKSIMTETTQKRNETSQQFDKLLQITSRCVDYYNKFIQQKDAQLRIVRQAFADIHQSLNTAFNGIINQVKTKHNEIKDFLAKKEKQLVKIKDCQEMELNVTLNDVKSVHLANLLRDYKNGDHSADMGEQLGNYANTLHKFYESMEKVQKCNFKQGVDETISFINNIITEQIKFIVYDRIPNKSLNGSFSFNDGLGFGSSICNSKAAITMICNDSNEQTILSENIDQIISQNITSRAKQTSQAWTQTINQAIIPKQSMLEALNDISKRQQNLKDKLQKYRELNF